MLFLPKNGKIVILDDQEHQAMPLIKALSKNKLPFTYHTDDTKLLPETPYDDLRVLFLDINLTDSPSDIKTIVSQLDGVLKLIVPENTPYILIIWSIKENDLASHVHTLLDTELKSRKPVVSLSLKKSDFFDYYPEQGYVLKEEGFDVILEIEKRIEVELSKMDTLEILIKWENLVHSSNSEIIKEIVQLAQLNDDFNVGIKTVLFKLAQAYWGKRLINLTLDKILALGLTNLNLSLIDKIEFKMNNGFNLTSIKDEKLDLKITSSQKATLNSKLLLSFDKPAEVLPGNIYVISKDKGVKRRIIQDIFDNKTFLDEFLENIRLPRNEVMTADENFNEGFFDKFQQFCNYKIDDISSKSEYIEVEVTPVCDFAQKKSVNHRTLSGVVLNSDFIQHFKRDADFFFRSGNVLIQAIDRIIVLDYRFLKGQDIGTFKNAEFLCRIRHLFLNEIQTQLARQVSRPGLVYIQ